MRNIQLTDEKIEHAPRARLACPSAVGARTKTRQRDQIAPVPSAGCLHGEIIRVTVAAMRCGADRWILSPGYTTADLSRIAQLIPGFLDFRSSLLLNYRNGR